MAMSHLRPTRFRGIVSFIIASRCSAVPGSSFARPADKSILVGRVPRARYMGSTAASYGVVGWNENTQISRLGLGWVVK